MTVDSPLRLCRLALPVVIPFVGLALEWLLWPLLNPFAWLLFYPVVFFSAWVGGVYGGLLATGLSAVLVWYFFLLPTPAAASAYLATLSPVAVFVALGVLFTLLHERLKRLEHAAANARFGALVEQSLAGIYIAQDGRLRYANPHLADMFGYDSLAEIIDRVPVLELVAPRDRDRVAAQLRGQVDQGIAAMTYSFAGRRRDGGELEVEVQGRLFQHEGSPAVIGLVLDLTNRRAAERAVREHMKRFELIARSVRETFFIFSPDLANAQFVSESFRRVFAIPPEELYRDPMIWMRDIEPADLEGVREALLTVRDGESAQVDFRVVRRDGALAWIGMRYQPIAGADGEALIVAVADDITDRKAAEDRRVRHAVSQRDALIREVHHRIKNNLQGVAGLLGEQALAHPELAGVIADAIKRLQAVAVVYGLQGASAASTPLLREMVSAIARGIEDVTGVCVAISVSARTDVSLQVREREAVPVALVINELVVNAIKHSSGPTAAGRVELELTEEAQAADVVIRNPGILPADFELDSERCAGVGLRLVRSLLPRDGAPQVSLSCDAGMVTTKLRLTQPAVFVEG